MFRAPAGHGGFQSRGPLHSHPRMQGHVPPTVLPPRTLVVSGPPAKRRRADDVVCYSKMRWIGFFDISHSPVSGFQRELTNTFQSSSFIVGQSERT